MAPGTQLCVQLLLSMIDFDKVLHAADQCGEWSLIGGYRIKWDFFDKILKTGLRKVEANRRKVEPNQWKCYFFNLLVKIDIPASCGKWKLIGGIGGKWNLFGGNVNFSFNWHRCFMWKVEAKRRIYGTVVESGV